MFASAGRCAASTPHAYQRVMTTPVMVKGCRGMAAGQHDKRHREGQVYLAKHPKCGRIRPDNVRHRNHPEEQRRDAGGSCRGSQISQTRRRDHKGEQGSVHSRGGAPLPIWSVVAECRTAAAPVQCQLSQRKQLLRHSGDAAGQAG